MRYFDLRWHPGGISCPSAILQGKGSEYFLIVQQISLYVSFEQAEILNFGLFALVNGQNLSKDNYQKTKC